MAQGIGTLDTGFHQGSGPDGVVSDIVALTNGKVLVAGAFSAFDGNSRRGLVQLNETGAVDLSFGPQITAPAGGGVSKILVDAAQRIYIGGNFTAVNGQPRRGLARLAADGSLDATFIPALPDGAIVASLAASLDGNALFVGGALRRLNADTNTTALAVQKLRLDGALDAGFTAPVLNSFVGSPTVYTISPLTDGRALVAGVFFDANNNGRFNICRLGVDGAIDTGFNATNPLSNTQIKDMAVASDGSVLIAGDFVLVGDYTAGCIARLSASGAVDRSFSFPLSNALGGGRPIINRLLITSDGRWLLGGNFRTANGVARSFLARAFADGTIDASFTASADNEVLALAEDAQGRFLIGGSFSKINGAAAPGLARLTRSGDAPVVRVLPSAGAAVAGSNLLLKADVVGAEGAIQWLRNGQPIPSAGAATLALVSVGSADAGVYTFRATNRFGTVNSQSIPVTVTPASAGALDSQFNAAREPFTIADAVLAPLADDSWAALTGGSSPKLIYYDASFAAKTAFDIRGFVSFTPTSAVSDPKGRLLVFGNFQLVNRDARKFVRLLADGVVDPTFTPPLSLYPQSFFPQADGRIVMLEGQYNYTIGRLLENGSIDAAFPRPDASCLAIQADGKIVYGRGYSRGDNRVNLSRLNVDGSSDGSFLPPIVQLPGAGGHQWVADGVSAIVIAPNGDIAAAVRSIASDPGIARTSSTGTLKSSYASALASTVNSMHPIAVDSESGAYIEDDKLGIFRLRSDGTLDSSLDLSDARDSGARAWQTATHGLLFKYVAGYVTGNPTTRFRHVLNTGVGEFRLANLSGRGPAGPGDNALIAGFVTSGNGATLVRSIGPTLRSFGVTDALPNPQLELYQGSTLIGQNSGWATGGNAPAIAALSAQVGAFALTAGSLDAALAPTLNGGAYTALIKGTSDSSNSTALAEVYEATPASMRLVNLSLRGRISGPNNPLIGGFVVTGSGSRNVLVRAVGPGLQAFGLGSLLNAPKLTLTRDGTVLRENTGWFVGDDGLLIEAAARRVGAFALANNSTDSALFLNLPPGSYTAVVVGADGGSGNVLIEVYAIID